MLGFDSTPDAAVTRTGTPVFPILMGLAGALVTGFLVTMNIAMALGFLVFMILFGVVVLHPAFLVPGLVVLTVLVERLLQPVGIAVGGRTLVNLGGVVNLCLAVSIVFYAATDRVRPFQSRLTPSFALYLAAVGLSLPGSLDPLMTVRSVVRIAAGYFIYLMITQFITQKRQIDRLALLVVGVSVIPIAMGLYQIVAENHFILSREMRIKGSFKNGMSYSMYLAFLLPYIFGRMAFGGGNWRRKGFFAILFGAGVANLVYSSTRIGLGAFALAMVVYALLADARKLLPMLLLAFVVAAIVFFPFFARSFGGYFKTDWNTYFSDNVAWEFRSQDYLTASSLHIRVYVWRKMMGKLMETNPWVGAGSGTWFQNLDRKVMGFSLASHSDYFEVLFGTGFVGLLFYVIFRVRQLTLLVRFADSSMERRIKTTVVFPCLATSVACLVMSVTEVWQAYNGIYWLSWIAIGICEAYFNWYSRQEAGGNAIAVLRPQDARSAGA